MRVSEDQGPRRETRAPLVLTPEVEQFWRTLGRIAKRRATSRPEPPRQSG